MISFRDYLPKHHVDAMAMTFTFFMIPISYLHGALYIAPTIWPTDETIVSKEIRDKNWLPYYSSVFVMTFLFINTYLNLILTTIVDTSCRRIALPVVMQPGWYFCTFCQYNAPPRTHHCSTCNRCILRRDHHCFFTGKCVGYYNHRYFIAFLIYLTFSALYGIVTSFMAISVITGGMSLTFIPAMIFPVLMWVFQMMPVNPFIMLEMSIAIFVTFGAGSLLILQLYQIYNGKTYYEFQKSIGNYRRGVWENFVDALGSNWWFCWVFPYLPSPRPGDGSQYLSRESAGANAHSHRGMSEQDSLSSRGDGKRKMVKSS